MRIVKILLDIDRIINPPPEPPKEPKFKSNFNINAIILGKPLSGKSTICKKLASELKLYVIDPESILKRIERFVNITV